MIREGFYIPGKDHTYVCDEPPEEVIAYVATQMRAGSRPALHLYPHSNPNEECRFMCADDVALYLAYRRLNIATVPAIVLAPGRQPLPNSAVEFKVSPQLKDAAPRIVGIVSVPLPEFLASSFEKGLPEAADQIVETLSKSIDHVIAKLRLFHSPMQEQLHYHHTIFSAAVRIQETLRSIGLLIKEDLWYQALALLRVLYEIHLNFYFDWLQPETNYRFLAAAAVWDTKGISQQRRLMANELVVKGMPEQLAVERANLAWKGVSMASTVSEKARLSKTGICFHKDIYDFLSRITHQDFEVASLHANRFERDEYLAIQPDVKATYLRFMDVIVTEILVCFSEDIGTVQLMPA